MSTVPRILFCGASSWLIVQFIPLVMLTEQFLEISVYKPFETHTTHIPQSICCTTVSWVAQHMPEVLLNKDEAAWEGGEGGSLDSSWPPLLKDGSLSPHPHPQKPFPPQSHLLTFIIYMVPAMLFFWTVMRCCSSLIQHKTKLAKRQSGQLSALLLEVACRRMLRMSGDVQSWEARAEAEESSRVGRTGVGLPSMTTRYQRYPMLSGCTPEPSRARMSNATPA